jgi:hypothetical protein
VNEDGVNVLGMSSEELGNYIKHELDAPERWYLMAFRAMAALARRTREGGS